MTRQNFLPVRLFLSLLVVSNLVAGTGLVLAASPGDGHLKRNGTPTAPPPES